MLQVQLKSLCLFYSCQTYILPVDIFIILRMPVSINNVCFCVLTVLSKWCIECLFLQFAFLFKNFLCQDTYLNFTVWLNQFIHFPTDGYLSYFYLVTIQNVTGILMPYFFQVGILDLMYSFNSISTGTDKLQATNSLCHAPPML